MTLLPAVYSNFVNQDDLLRSDPDKIVLLYFDRSNVMNSEIFKIKNLLFQNYIDAIKN
jgi:hypothetical protein